MAESKEPAVAKAVKKEARKALAKRNLERGLRTDRVREDGVQMLLVQTTVRIPVTLARPLPGRWSVHLNWLFEPIPPHRDFQLLRSSFGLSVAGLTDPAVSDIQNLVRYDVDNARLGPGGIPLGRHIDVWQPNPIEDNVHYPVPGENHGGWVVEDVLAFFFSDVLAEDLAGRIN